MCEFMIQAAVSEKRNYIIISYLSFQQKCIFSQTYYLKILTENRQRTEPTDLPKIRAPYHPNFPNCDQISPTLLRVTIRRNCIKRSRVLEGAENNGNN